MLGLLVLQPRPVPETDASEDKKSASCPASAIPCPDHKELHYPVTLRRATCSGVLRMRKKTSYLPPTPSLGPEVICGLQVPEAVGPRVPTARARPAARRKDEVWQCLSRWEPRNRLAGNGF